MNVRTLAMVAATACSLVGAFLLLIEETGDKAPVLAQRPADERRQNAGARSDQVPVPRQPIEARSEFSSPNGSRKRKPPSTGRVENPSAPSRRNEVSASSEWSARMESKIWGALQGIDEEFVSIYLVECHEPTCEIQFNGVEPIETPAGVWYDFANELTHRIGRDEQGAPIVRQVGFGTREIYPGMNARVMRLSTESREQ